MNRLGPLNRYLLSILVPPASVLFLVSCVTHDHRTAAAREQKKEQKAQNYYKVTYPLPSTPFKVPMGRSLSVEMNNPGTGGYLLQVPEYDRRVVEMRRDISVPPPVNDRKVGDSGDMVYVFKAIAPGFADIIFRIYKPRETNIPAQECTRVKVAVTRPKS